MRLGLRRSGAERKQGLDHFTAVRHIERAVMLKALRSKRWGELREKRFEVRTDFLLPSFRGQAAAGVRLCNQLKRDI